MYLCQGAVVIFEYMHELFSIYRREKKKIER